MEAGRPQSELIESYCLTHRRKPIQTEAFLELTDGGGGGGGEGQGGMKADVSRWRHLKSED